MSVALSYGGRGKAEPWDGEAQLPNKMEQWSEPEWEAGRCLEERVLTQRMKILSLVPVLPHMNPAVTRNYFAYLGLSFPTYKMQRMGWRASSNLQPAEYCPWWKAFCVKIVWEVSCGPSSFNTARIYNIHNFLKVASGDLWLIFILPHGPQTDWPWCVFSPEQLST